MIREYTSGVRSKASLAGHPLHPVFIVFPAAFLIGLLASDLAFGVTRDPFWARASLWLALAGLVMGCIAGLLGIIELVGVRRVRELPAAWIHGLGNVAVLVLTFFNVFDRWANPGAFILPAGLELSAITAAILLVTAWLGGELTYRYGIGVLIKPTATSVTVRRYDKVA